MAIDVSTVLEAIAVIGNEIPEFNKLIDEVKTVMNTSDQTVLADALATSGARADQQHTDAQNL